MIIAGKKTEIKDVFGCELVNNVKTERDIIKVWYGTHLVWEKVLVFDLGTRKFDNYDIRSYYDDWANLTVNNFFIVNMNNATGTAKVVINGYTQYLIMSGKLIKSYNASTGRFTCYNQCQGQSAQGTNTTGYGNVHVILVTDLSKVKNLGTAQSFNVTSYSGYKNFTVDNFLIRNASDYYESHSRTVDGTWLASSTMKLYKNYNASKGLLTCYYYEEGSNNAGSSDFVSSKQNVRVYLMQ